MKIFNGLSKLCGVIQWVQFSRRVGFIFTSLILAGCSSFSGLDAKAKFTCQAPDGILCESMSGIYANIQANNLVGQQHNQKQLFTLMQVDNQQISTEAIVSGTPIRTPPKIVRIWFAPWEDTDGDLHDQSYVYLQVDFGRWMIEHNQRYIQKNFRPISAPDSIDPNKSTLIQKDFTSPQTQYSPLSDNSKESIGVHQDRVSPEQTADFLEGVLQPSDLSEESDLLDH